jgi:hypothetical protein
VQSEEHPIHDLLSVLLYDPVGHELRQFVLFDRRYPAEQLEHEYAVLSRQEAQAGLQDVH